MRTFLGVVLLVLGIPILLVGAVVAVVVGPDDTVDVITETVESESRALVISPSVLGVSGLTLHVAAEVDGPETFVGAAHPVHVSSYLDGVAHIEVSDINRSREVTLTEIPAGGDEITLPPPNDLDWWQTKTSGAGLQELEVELTDEPVAVVVSAAEPAPPLTTTVTAALGWDGLFIAAVLVGVLGLALVVLGFLARRSGRQRKHARLEAARDERAPGNHHDDVADTTPGVDQPGDGSPPPPTPLRPYRPSSMRPPPPPPRGDEGRSRRIVGAVLPVTALLAGGCAAIPQSVDTASSPLVAATPEQNESFFAAYTETNNAANAAQDPQSLMPIETGPQLAASEFGFEVERAQDIAPTEPFTVSPTALAAPQFESYPLFYVSSATIGGSTTSHYLLTRPTAREPWRAAAVVDLTEDQPFDLVATVTSSPSIADAGDAGLAALDVVREYAETGQAPEGLDITAAGSLADLPGLGYSADPEAEGIASLTRACEIGLPVDGAWLETSSGALTIATATCTQELQTDEGYWFTPDAPYGTIPGGVDITATTVTAVVPFIAQVSDDGTVVAHGGRLSLTQTDAVTR